MKLSAFGEQFTRRSGILSLMNDLSNALAGNDDIIMMGGGNPAHLPGVEEVFRQRLNRILGNQEEFTRFIGTYDSPAGEQDFRQELAAMLKRCFGWNLSRHNICLTHGSQSAFFMLFNAFAGKNRQGLHRRIQLPVTPEYIGYANSGIEQDIFAAEKPEFEFIDGHTFKYRINFDALDITEDIAALCVSRPTNPTGNVLTDGEIEHLNMLARQHDIPLIIDGAYGLPFPNLIFTDATPYWNEHIILCLSLSKLGLPATRTGIVIASEEVISTITSMNAIINLAPNSSGALLALDMIRDDSVMTLSNQYIRPWYSERMKMAAGYLKKQMGGLPWYMHKPEGAMFLWLWFRDLPISSLELYERLKKRGVLTVSGHYFFFGTDNNWQHRYECLRVTFACGAEETVRKGLAVIADEVRHLYNG